MLGCNYPAREHRQPDAAQARHVAAEAVDDHAGDAAPARLRGEQLSEDGLAVAVARDDEHVARARLREGAEDGEVVVLGDDGQRRPGEADVGHHGADLAIDHRQRLVRVTQGRHLDREQAPDERFGVRSHGETVPRGSRRGSSAAPPPPAGDESP